MKTGIISILIAVFSLTAFANTTQLHYEPNDLSRLLATDTNPSDLFVIEKTGAWSRVVNTKTGLVGWTKMPILTDDEIVSEDDEGTNQDPNIVDEENEDDDIRGMILALI
jgi:hypothetical protein